MLGEHDHSEHEVDRRSVNTLRDALCKQKIIKRVERQLDAAWSEEKVVLFCPKDEPADSPRITCKVLLTLRKRVRACRPPHSVVSAHWSFSLGGRVWPLAALDAHEGCDVFC